MLSGRDGRWGSRRYDEKEGWLPGSIITSVLSIYCETAVGSAYSWEVWGMDLQVAQVSLSDQAAAPYPACAPAPLQRKLRVPEWDWASILLFCDGAPLAQRFLRIAAPCTRCESLSTL